jgi:hypothetical protein
MAFDFSSTSCAGDVEEISAVCYREGYEEFLERDDDDQYLQDLELRDNDDTILRIMDAAPFAARESGAALLNDALDQDPTAAALNLRLDAEWFTNAVRAVEDPQEYIEDFDDDSNRLDLEVTYFLGTCSLQQAVPLSLEFLPMLESPEDTGAEPSGRLLSNAWAWAVTHRTTPSALHRGVLGVPLEWAVLAAVSALALVIFSASVAVRVLSYTVRKPVPAVLIV